MVGVRAFGKSSIDALQRESERLAALEAFDLLDTPRDDGFERITHLIQEIFAVDMAIVSLIDAHRQWYKSCVGFADDEVSRGDSFCQYIVESQEPMVVADTTRDRRFSKHPAVTGEAHVRFYAGAPLTTREGHVIGTLCAIDRRPRSFSAKDLAILQTLAGLAMDRIELLQTAATDSLTGALTRRAFKHESDQAIALARRHRHDLACIVLDVDHFKNVNDTYGHATGDEVLKAIVRICKKALRAEDLLGRLGGEEFSILLPHVDRSGAIAVAEKIRLAIASEAIVLDHNTLEITVSLGLSSLSIVSKDIDTLLAQADVAMYEAKHKGRNRSVAWNSIQADHVIGSRRRVLRAGSIIFNNRQSTVDCTIKSLGSDSAGLCVSSATGIPPEFLLVIRGEGFETNCRVIAQDRQNIEVSFLG